MELFRRCFWTSLLIAVPVSLIVWWISHRTQNSIPVNSQFEDPSKSFATVTFLLTVIGVTSVQCLRWFVVSRQRRAQPPTL